MLANSFLPYPMREKSVVSRYVTGISLSNQMTTDKDDKGMTSSATFRQKTLICIVHSLAYPNDW